MTLYVSEYGRLTLGVKLNILNAKLPEAINWGRISLSNALPTATPELALNKYSDN